VRAMATPRTISATRALAALATPLVLVSILALVIQASAQATSAGKGCTGAYGWPVTPFDRAHPVRANFGDPRTRFEGLESTDTLLGGNGTFSFHQGVDISAPDGSPVYAVASGRIVRARGGRVTVDCGNGRSIQYWHIHPAVRAGQRAVAGETVLGFIQPKREHVHLTHLERNRPVNPLALGHLAPYRDRTVPRVVRIGVRRHEPGSPLLRFIAEATDAPALSVPGRWNGFPVTPARLAWRIERDGRIVVPTRVARDVRGSVPRNDGFWTTFARGTHQNWPIYAGRKLQLEPGRYVFRLAIRPFDTRQLRAGVYELVVTAQDTAGNRDTRRLHFVVDGAPTS
jgi:murein DD-endopeptidase MepM/ murein hydrolase activator NlpD